MHREGEPALQPGVAEAVVRVQVVVVVMQTFAELDSRFQLLGLGVAAHLHNLARLDASQHSNQPLAASALGRHVQGGFFLAFLAVVQKAIYPRLLGLGLDGPAQGDGRFLGVVLLVIHERHLQLPQEIQHPSRIAQQPFAAAETQVIKTMKNPEDKGAKTL